MPSSKVMHEFKEGHLNSGKGGPIVKNRKQAVAIMLSEKRKEKGEKGLSFSMKTKHPKPSGKYY